MQSFLSVRSYRVIAADIKSAMISAPVIVQGRFPILRSSDYGRFLMIFGLFQTLRLAQTFNPGHVCTYICTKRFFMILSFDFELRLNVRLPMHRLPFVEF